MKLETLLAILIAAGLPQARINEVKENFEKEDYAPNMDEFKADIRNNQISLFRNDSELVGEIQRNETAKQLDIVDRWLKQEFGLTAEDVKDKKTKELIAVAKSKALENSNKTSEQLNVENMELKARIKKMEEEEIPGIKTQVETEKQKMKIDASIEKMARDFQYRNPFEAVYTAQRSLLDNEFNYVLNEAGEIDLLDKKTGLKAKTSDGTGFLTLKDAWKDRAKRNEFLKESNADEGSGGAGGNGAAVKPKTEQKIQADELSQRYPHLAKAQSNLEEVKVMPKP